MKWEKHDSNNELYRDCNAGVQVINKKLGILNTSINFNGISNILYIPELQRSGYCVTYYTRVKYMVQPLEVDIINLNNGYSE